jgi:hypothetical protein
VRDRLVARHGRRGDEQGQRQDAADDGLLAAGEPSVAAGAASSRLPPGFLLKRLGAVGLGGAVAVDDGGLESGRLVLRIE